MKNQVRVRKGYNVSGFPEVFEVQARRKWQREWTILRVYTHESVAMADAFLIIQRGKFTDEEKKMMKGAS
jgi:hypothetical protein